MVVVGHGQNSRLGAITNIRSEEPLTEKIREGRDREVQSKQYSPKASRTLSELQLRPCPYALVSIVISRLQLA